MMFLWLPFLFLIPFAMMWMMRSGNGGGMGCCGMDHSGTAHTPSAGSTGPDPMDIARQRLARGEIDSAQFDEIRRALG
jgi:uncharacterized membrane protein